jgi:hypothetical protein
MPEIQASQAQSEIWTTHDDRVEVSQASAAVWYRVNDRIDITQAVAVVWYEPREGRVYGPAIISM